MGNIRVSASALVRLVYQDKYALLGSRSGFERTGLRVLKPIGGAIETTQAGWEHLTENFGATDFEEGLDLRLRLPKDQLDSFRRWFMTGNQLEPHPARREYREELGPPEHGLLTAGEAQQGDFRHARSVVECILPSIRRGQEGVMTHCFFRVYEATIPPAILTKLVVIAQSLDNQLEFVTAAEITAGNSMAGSKILELCRFVI